MPVIKGNSMRLWFFQIRGPFLILSVVLVAVGVAAAYHEGFENWLYAFLLVFGVMLSHVSVNLFNELSDYRTGVDEFTVRTPFSGGSGLLQSRQISLKAVAFAAYAALIFSAAIGFYLWRFSGWVIPILMVSGALAVRFYTSHLTQWLMGEAVAGLTLGTFVVLGSYYALTRHLNFEIIIVSIPPGILTFLLLFLNEFPDVEADRKGGRHHLVIHFGREKSSKIYLYFLALAYLILFASPFVADLPRTMLISLATLPLAVKAARGATQNYNDMAKLVPTLALNVGIVIMTDLLLSIGFFI